MEKYKRILLLGFRCVGKTTISKKLSNIMNIPLIDIDEEIEKKQGKTISEITNNGENWVRFRELELKKLEEVLKIDNIIISAGGGVGVNDVKYDDNFTYGYLQRDLIKRSTDTLKVLLFANERVLRDRLYLSKINENNRPDLYNKTNSITEYIESNIQTMKKREKFYKEMADLVFDASDKDDYKNTINLIKMIKDYEI